MTSLWIVPLLAVALTQVVVLATSMYLHRALAHRSVVVHPAADLLFRTVLWLTTGQDRREWVAVHRKRSPIGTATPTARDCAASGACSS